MYFNTLFMVIVSYNYNPYKKKYKKSIKKV